MRVLGAKGARSHKHQHLPGVTALAAQLFSRAASKRNDSLLQLIQAQHRLAKAARAISRLCLSHDMTMQQIMDMTGHKNFTTFQGYVQLYAMHERKALQKATADSTSEPQELITY